MFPFKCQCSWVESDNFYRPRELVSNSFTHVSLARLLLSNRMPIDLSFGILVSHHDI